MQIKFRKHADCYETVPTKILYRETRGVNANNNFLRCIDSLGLIRDHPPIPKSDHPFFHPVDYGRIMRGDDDGFSHCIQLFENPHDLPGVRGIQISSRLVADDDLRIMDERTGDRDALDLSARQLVYEVVRFPQKSHLRQHLGHALGDFVIAIS